MYYFYSFTHSIKKNIIFFSYFTAALAREFVLSKSKNMNKTYTTKDTRGKAEKGLVWKKDGIRDLIM